MCFFWFKDLINRESIYILQLGYNKSLLLQTWLCNVTNMFVFFYKHNRTNTNWWWLFGKQKYKTSIVVLSRYLKALEHLWSYHRMDLFFLRQQNMITAAVIDKSCNKNKSALPLLVMKKKNLYNNALKSILKFCWLKLRKAQTKNFYTITTPLQKKNSTNKEYGKTQS